MYTEAAMGLLFKSIFQLFFLVLKSFTSGRVKCSSKNYIFLFKSSSCSTVHIKVSTATGVVCLGEAGRGGGATSHGQGDWCYVLVTRTHSSAAVLSATKGSIISTGLLAQPGCSQPQLCNPLYISVQNNNQDIV